MKKAAVFVLVTLIILALPAVVLAQADAPGIGAVTTEQLGAIAGIVLSLVFSYIPGVNSWFDALTKGQKQAIMGGLLVAVALAVFGLSCSNVILVVECTQDGALGLATVLVQALVANQAIYLITKK